MYSKANYRSDNIIIPDNYRGNAFPEPRDNASPPTDKEEKAPISQEALIPQNAVERDKAEHAHPTLISSLLPPKPTNSGGFLSNIGVEEMLIAGIIFLLTQSDVDDDIILLLLLLLFYK
jgi:hypothetical protein